MSQGRRLFVVATALWALLLVVSLIEGEVLWSLASGALLVYFGWWLLTGRRRLRERLEQAIAANRELADAGKRKKKSRQSG
jgi:outer membrane protein TolC